MRRSPAPKRDDHSPIVQRAALALLLTLASWVPFGPNKGRVGRLKAFAPGLPTRQSEASPVASACLPAARSWRNFSCSWCKQQVDAACIPPGCVPSGRPIESTLVSWVPLGPNKGRMGRLCAFGPGLPTRQSGTIASAWLPAIRSWRNFSCSWRKHDVAATRIPPRRALSGRPIERIAPHLLKDSRPGPKSGAGCRLTTLLILLHCQLFHSVRVPALSVGAGEGNSLAYQRRLQVPKLNGVQVTDGKQGPTHKWNRCVKRSFMPACNRATRHCQAQPLCLCTSSFIKIPEECVAADHRCLVPNADRLPAAATYPILGWDGPHWAPAPRMLRDVVWVLTLRPSGSQLVSARKLCSGDALRPDLSWVLNYTVPSVPSKGHLQFTGLQGAERGPQCALLGPLAVHRTTGCCAWSSVCPPGATAVLRTALCTEKHHDECKMP